MTTARREVKPQRHAAMAPRVVACQQSSANRGAGSFGLRLCGPSGMLRALRSSGFATGPGSFVRGRVTGPAGCGASLDAPIGRIRRTGASGSVATRGLVRLATTKTPGFVPGPICRLRPGAAGLGLVRIRDGLVCARPSVAPVSGCVGRSANQALFGRGGPLVATVVEPTGALWFIRPRRTAVSAARLRFGSENGRRDRAHQ